MTLHRLSLFGNRLRCSLCPGTNNLTYSDNIADQAFPTSLMIDDRLQASAAMVLSVVFSLSAASHFETTRFQESQVMGRQAFTLRLLA